MNLLPSVASTARLVLVALATALLAGCAGALSAAAAPPRPVCAAAPDKGKPALCFPRGGSELFVVGLPEAHGWERGDWVMLDVTREGFATPVSAAMAVVVERYGDLAKVQMLYQREAQSLDGARARRISKEERARLGKFVGRIRQVDLARIRIDVGALDKVEVGDVYQVLSPRDHQPIGRLQVTEVGDVYAFATRLEQRDELREGLDVVYLQRAAREAAAATVLILVVNFDPHDPSNSDAAKAGRGFAKDLANALAEAAEGPGGIIVRYDEEERVRLASGDEEGHKQARSVGKRFAADIVVWGAIRFEEQACAAPRFTVVEPAASRRWGYAAAEICVERDQAGFALQGQAQVDTAALVEAILGVMAAERRPGSGQVWGGLLGIGTINLPPNPAAPKPSARP